MIRTGEDPKHKDPDSDFGVAHRLGEQIPNSLYIGQVKFIVKYRVAHGSLSHFASL